MSIVGARPQFVKLAPIAQALTDRNAEHIIVHTGQHYDQKLSASIFSDLGIPAPNYNLSIGSGAHGAQTGRMLESIENCLDQVGPDKVLVYGDTNSTVAGALAASKQHIYVAHLEAGLRSNNRRMPEEINRIATDHISDLCLAPTENAMRILASEGLSSRAVLVGDVMADVCLNTHAAVLRSRPSLPFDATDSFGVATIHRAENTDSECRLSEIIHQLSSLPIPVILPAHPRLISKAQTHDIDINVGNIHLVDPLTYSELIYAVAGASFIVTDSGGLQKEAMLLGAKCTTVRPETEWPETLENDMNQLVEPHEIRASAIRPDPRRPESTPFGTGNASTLVADILVRP